MAQIILQGGFHNSKATKVAIKESAYNALKNGEASIDTIVESLPNHTKYRLWRHFCGIKDCMCGGVCRASVYFN